MGKPCCASGVTIDECHLAENAALAQRTNESVANADFDSSAFHDEELYRGMRTGPPALIKRSKSPFPT
jgi:hypothetical protein